MNQKQFDIVSRALAKSLGISKDELFKNFHRADHQDVQEIIALRKLGFGELNELDEKIIRWRYFDNSNHSSDMYVLKVGKKIIAAVGAEPICVKLKNETVEGVKTADIVVLPEHMKKGIGGWMNLFMQSKFDLVMAMGANENSRSMVRRLFRPMNCRNNFKLLFSAQDYLYQRGVPRVLAKLFDLIVWTPLCWLETRRLSGFDKSYQVSIASRFSEAEAFIKNSEPLDYCEKFVMRDSSFYKWRFFENPKSRYQLLMVAKGGRPVGMITLQMNEIASEGDAALMDWYLCPDYKNLENMSKLFFEASRHLKNAGAKTVSVMTTDEQAMLALKRCFYSWRSVDDGFYLYLAAKYQTVGYETQHWYLSFADTDEKL